jgi:glycerol uptake facilitator-like aquaporin
MSVVTVAPAMGVVVPGLGHGLILVGMILAFGKVSGGHFNPAVTLSLLIGGKEKDIVKVIVYMLVQIAAAIVAALVVVWAIPETVHIIPEGSTEWNFGLATGSMTKAGGGLWFAVVLEAIQVFLLVTAVFQAAVYARAGDNAALAIGFTLGALILSFGIYTGASVNPARTIGPGLVAGQLDHILPYLIGHAAGAAIGGLVNGYVIKGE